MQAESFLLLRKSFCTTFFPLKWALLAPLLFIILSSGIASGAGEDPLPPIEKTVEEILTILRSKKDNDWNATRQRISAIIQKRFDFQEQSRLVLGDHWQERSDAEKDHFISLFSTIQEHVYLNRLEDYSGETVQFTKKIVKEDKALVFSAIVKDQEEIPIVYRMSQKEDKWLVYDVIIDGVSLVKNYRQQFSSILEKETYTDLVHDMEEKIKKIESEKN